MQNGKVMTVLKIGLVVAAAATTAACASNDDLKALEAKVDALETKLHDTMQTAATAKVDGSTALHIATQNQEKLDKKK